MRLIIIFIISAFIWPAYKAVQTYVEACPRIGFGADFWCPQNSRCRTDLGTCLCSDGYVFDRTTKVCESKTCHTGLKCTVGGICKNSTCVCDESDYYFDGQNCVANTCHNVLKCPTGATCKDSTCVCEKSGYSVAGETCVDINECEMFPAEACLGSSTCFNTDGSYACLCDRGSTYDGTTCVANIHEVDFCVENTMPATQAIFVFQRTKLVPLTNPYDAVEMCAAIGGDILHYRPSGPPCNFKTITANYFSRDYTAVYQIEILEHSSLSSSNLLCQRPVQPCRGFGTLFVPKYVDFRKQLTYEDGQTSCKNLLGVIPTTEQSQSECAKNMAKRMQTLFKLTDLPSIWTSDASDKSDTRHVLCYADGSEEKLEDQNVPYQYFEDF